MIAKLFRNRELRSKPSKSKGLQRKSEENYLKKKVNMGRGFLAKRFIKKKTSQMVSETSLELLESPELLESLQWRLLLPSPTENL